MVVSIMPLITIWFGLLTLVCFIATLVLGIMVHKFHKNVFSAHISFAALTFILAAIHAVLAYLYFVKGA
jgi:hypothetical protein